MKRMRAELETVAEFLSKHGGAEEAASLVSVLAKMGWEVPHDSKLRLRQLLATMRQELHEPDGMDYAFFFGRLISICTHDNMPVDLSKAFFSSKLFLHIAVERFASAYEGLDSELFKLESDVLCHADGIFGSCLLLQNNVFNDESESSVLKRFLDDFTVIFEDDDPKARWDEFYETHRINYAAFHRDMKRALWRIEDALVGKTELELLLAKKHIDDASERPKKRISRAALEKKFTGTPQDWKNLSVVNSVRLEKEREQIVIEDEEEPEAPSRNQEISDARSSQENRVWSTRLPFATSGVTSDSSVSEVDDDQPYTSNNVAAVPASPPPQHNRPTSASSTRDDSLMSLPPAAADDNNTTDDAEVSDTNTDVSMLLRRPKRKRWSQAEVSALQKGYKEFSSLPNVWVMIKSKYAAVLSQRSNVDIKDKYRNLLKYRKIAPETTDDDQQTQEN